MDRNIIEAEALGLFRSAGFNPAAAGGPESLDGHRRGDALWPALERDLTSEEIRWWGDADDELDTAPVSSYHHEDDGCDGSYISSRNPLYNLLNFLAGEEEDEQAVRNGLELLRRAVSAKNA